MPKKFRIVTFFIQRRNLNIVGTRKHIYQLGNRVVDYWFFEYAIKDDSRPAIKSYLKRLMRRVLGRCEKTVDYLGTFESKNWHNAIFVVVFGENAQYSEEHPVSHLSRFYFTTNSTCKRMLNEVKQLLSVRYPELYKRFVEMKNRSERTKIIREREKYDPSEKERKPVPRKFKRRPRSGPAASCGNGAEVKPIPV